MPASDAGSGREFLADSEAGSCRGLPSRVKSVSRVEVHQQTTIVDDDGQQDTVAARINAIGFGLYQLQVFVLCSGFVVAEASALMTVSGTMAAITAEFNIQSTLGQSMIMMSTFCGFGFGTISSGPLGDSFGRRVPMLIGYSGVVLSSFLIFCAAVSINVLYVLLLCLGFFSGIGIPAALITLSEVAPSSLRGISTAALGLAFSLGELWAAIGLKIIMPTLLTGNWRLVVLWAAQPAMLMLLFGALSPVSRYDTPPFMAVTGRSIDLVGCINLIAEMNGQPELRLQVGHSLTVEKKGALSFARSVPMLTRWPISLYGASLCFIFFAKDFTFYGMGVFWPLAWAQVRGLQGMSPATELILTSLVGVPGIGVAMGLIYALPRRQALALGAMMCCIASVGLRQLESGGWLGLAGVVLFKLSFSTWQMMTMLLPSEIFPTQVRSCAYSIVATMGRVGTMVAPIFISQDRLGFLSACTFMAIFSAIAVHTLPETKDCELDNIDSFQNDKNADESKGGIALCAAEQGKKGDYGSVG